MSMRRDDKPMDFDLGPDILNKTLPNFFDAGDQAERFSMIDENIGGKGNVGTVQTYFNIFKCFIGIGILATPSAFQQVGWFGGSVGIIVCGVINVYTMTL